MIDQEEEIFDANGNYDELTAKIKSTGIYQYNISYLNCPELDDNPTFTKLKNRLVKFFIIEEKHRINGPTKR